MPEELDDGFRVRNEVSGGQNFGIIVQGGRVQVHYAGARPGEQPPGGLLGRYRVAVALMLLGLAVLCVAMLNSREQMLPSTVHRAILATGAVLLCGGVVWAAVVLLGIPERLRARRSSRRMPSDQLVGLAERLAETLADEYEDEERHLRVHDPLPIPVLWSAASPRLSDHNANILGRPATASDAACGQRLSLDGHFGTIGHFFTTRLPRHRLVILGAPGAGKSVLAMQLARDLLRERAAGGAVPVLLPLASWKPAEEDPWHWAARRLAAEHPSVLRTQQLAHEFITSGGIIPILDGLDEMPEPARAEALRKLRRSLHEPARIVLTCRDQEYDKAVTDASTALPAAAVVQLQPLTTDDLVAYLPRTALISSDADAAATKWAPVLRKLTDPASGTREAEILRSVLTTPLMVSLARFAYSDTHADPAELLDADRFGDRADVERHLFDAFLTAAYEDSSDGPWSGRQVRRWLAHLAAHLRRTGEQDIEWWRLGDLVPWPVRWLGTGLAVGVAALATGLTSYDHPWWREWVPLPPWAVVLVLGWVAACVEWGVMPPAGPPRRLHWPTREELGISPKERNWLVGALSCFAGATVVMLLDSTTFMGIAVFLLVMLCPLLLPYVLGLLSRPADPVDAPDPSALLRADRRSELVLGLFALFRPCHRLFLTEGVLGITFMTVILWQVSAEWRTSPGGLWLRTTPLLLLAWLLCSWSASAGGRLAVARLWLFFSGAQPWRMMTFLRDAHRRDVLRQSGGRYRFRHIELRNRLAEAGGVAEDVDGGPVAVREGTDRTEGIIAAWVAGAALLGLLGLAASLLQPDMASPYRRPDSVCALLPPTLVKELIAEPVVYEEDDFTCDYDEKSPFRPDRRIYAGVIAWKSSPGEGSGVELARESMRERGLRYSAPVPGLADEAQMSVARVVPHGAPQANVRMRAGNLVLYVSYREEYATRGRVTEVARILAQEMMRGLGVPSESVGTAARDLSDVPRAKAPVITPAGGYRLPERSVHGAAWEEDEYSDIVAFKGLSMPVRTSRDLYCAADEVPLRTGRFATRCQSPDDRIGRDGPGPRLRLDIAEGECAAAVCTAAEIRAFQRSRPGGHTTRWQKASAGDAQYAVRTAKDGRYEMSLVVSYTLQGGIPQLVWIRASVAEAHAELAQKIVNSAYTQATLR